MMIFCVTKMSTSLWIWKLGINDLWLVNFFLGFSWVFIFLQFREKLMSQSIESNWGSQILTEKLEGKLVPIYLSLSTRIISIVSKYKVYKKLQVKAPYTVQSLGLWFGIWIVVSSSQEKSHKIVRRWISESPSNSPFTVVLMERDKT